MTVYLVKEVGSVNYGRLYSTREEAEKQAGYLNDIPDDSTYIVKAVEVGI